MESPLHRLVYYSRNHIAAESFDAAIAEILAKSRTNNSHDGITGALLFNQGCFAQVLEGPIDPVETAFERIQQDPRHGEVALLALDPIEQRGFATWAMGFVGASQGHGAHFAEVATETGFDPARLDGEQVYAVLKRLMIEEEAA